MLFYFLLKIATPIAEGNAAGEINPFFGQENKGNYGPFPGNPDELEDPGLPSERSALRNASRSRMSAQFMVPNANHSSGGYIKKLVLLSHFFNPTYALFF